MESTLPSFVQNNMGFAIITGLITFVGVFINILKGAFDFHYEYFTRRHLRRMTDLLPQVEPGSLHQDFLKQAISAEVFKIASGVKTTNRNAAALMHLCKFKRISPSQVKKTLQYLKLMPSGHVTLAINTLDRVSAYYSLTAAVVIFIFGIYAFVNSIIINLAYGWIAGAIMFLFCSFVVGFFLKDWRNYQQVKKTQKELHDNPLPICNESKSVTYQNDALSDPAN